MKLFPFIKEGHYVSICYWGVWTAMKTPFLWCRTIAVIFLRKLATSIAIVDVDCPFCNCINSCLVDRFPCAIAIQPSPHYRCCKKCAWPHGRIPTGLPHGCRHLIKQRQKLPRVSLLLPGANSQSSLKKKGCQFSK